MSTIIPNVTWGRSQTPSGKGRWHLLAVIRKNTSGARIAGRWGSVEPGGVFGVATCGMTVNDPEYEPQPKLVSKSWWGTISPFPVPTTSHCLPCAEAAIRDANSKVI